MKWLFRSFDDGWAHEVLAIKEQSFRPTHPSTKLGRRNYAGLLRALGREEEATGLEAKTEPGL